jgi:lipopolysaccharide transport system ATP-binding protein
VLQQLASNVSPVSKDASITVSGLSKTYRIYTREHQPTTAAEAVIKKMKRSGPKKVVEQFQALHDVSFEVNWG